MGSGQVGAMSLASASDAFTGRFTTEIKILMIENEDSERCKMILGRPESTLSLARAQPEFVKVAICVINHDECCIQI